LAGDGAFKSTTCSSSSGSATALFSAAAPSSESGQQQQKEKSDEQIRGSSGENGGDTNENNQNDSPARGEEQAIQEVIQEQERTLYEILESPPTATTRQLRQNYVRLAKRMHPDAIGAGASSREGAAEFSEVAAAWRILGDAKQRLRYDRQLKAKEFSDSMGDLFEATFRFGIAAAETSAKQFSKTAQQVARARALQDLRAERNALLARAAKEEARADELKRRLQLEDRKTDILQKSSSELTSAEARRVMQQFEYLEEEKGKDGSHIEALIETENAYKDTVRQYKNAQRNVQAAEDKVNAALVAEERAQKRLEEAMRALEEAKATVKQSKQGHKDATQEERKAKAGIDQAMVTLDKQKDKTKKELRKQEDDNLIWEDTYLKKESAKLDELVLKLRKEAEDLDQQYEALNREPLKEEAE